LENLEEGAFMVTMRNQPIITSLLDQDLYKLTMSQAVLHQFPGAEVEYAFKCRNKAVWTPRIVERINEEVDNLCALKFSQGELEYLSNIRFLKPDYIDFLSLMKLNRKHINVTLDENQQLCIRIKGGWLLTILFEVPILAIVNEIYYQETYPDISPYYNGHPRLIQKAKLLEGLIQFFFSDFGTRRRYSFIWQKEIVKFFVDNFSHSGIFTGTSNVLLAKTFGLRPIGTMAHEWIQCGQATGVRLIDSQKRMLQAWVDEYRGDLGYALSDTLGTDAFLHDFDQYFAKLYDGVRQDSGDPIVWGQRIIQHYKSLGIDPRTKSLIFSDSLDFPKAININETFKDQAKVSFGIGTYLTNDIEGIEPLNAVIKVVRCNGQPVAKISDSPGKGMCEDQEYVTYLKRVFSIKE
jgi:nicotinate phosphoribosyltransferase